jgi:hypothetical protein
LNFGRHVLFEITYILGQFGASSSHEIIMVL